MNLEISWKMSSVTLSTEDFIYVQTLPLIKQDERNQSSKQS